MRLSSETYKFEPGRSSIWVKTMKKILILAANPKETNRLRLDREVRDIEEGLRRAKHRDDFELVQKWAVRPRDIHRALLDEKPQIIHFSGHGAGEVGLVFEDEAGNTKLIDGEALANLFRLFADDIDCILLNGCYSQEQAKGIVQHIDYVIGMSRAIADTAAIEFSVAFYDAIGSGRPYEFSYQLACAVIQLNMSIPKDSGAARKLIPLNTDQTPLSQCITPVLLKRPGSAMKILEKEISKTENELLGTLSTNCKEALHWLSRNQSSLSKTSFKYTRDQLPDVFQDLSVEIKEDFQWELEKYLESIYFAILSSSFYLLDEPVIKPSIDSSEVYQAAFTIIKKKIPSRVGCEVIELISNRFDYLLERLFV